MAIWLYSAIKSDEDKVMVERSVGFNPSGAPLYKEVKRKIVESIRNGEWKPGEVIPSEKKLCERFAVSMGTIRKAVDDLSGEGLLIRQQGRGTFVATHNQDRYLFAFFHVVRQDGHKEYPTVELMEFSKVKADPGAISMLHLDPGSRLFRFVNKLELGRSPVVVDEILLPEQLFSRLTERTLRERSAKRRRPQGPSARCEGRRSSASGNTDSIFVQGSAGGTALFVRAHASLRILLRFNGIVMSQAIFSSTALDFSTAIRNVSIDLLNEVAAAALIGTSASAASSPATIL
ncbi:MAG: GntR family transcriptional regulator [Sulfuritalea sp.]|nr:GntR family transcriptional regulator [Sulfuritalea sp.]